MVEVSGHNGIAGFKESLIVFKSCNRLLLNAFGFVAFVGTPDCEHVRRFLFEIFALNGMYWLNRELMQSSRLSLRSLNAKSYCFVFIFANPVVIIIFKFWAATFNDFWVGAFRDNSNVRAEFF